MSGGRFGLSRAALRLCLRIFDHRLERVVVEFTRRGGAGLAAVPNGDRELLIELDEVGR